MFNYLSVAFFLLLVLLGVILICVPLYMLICVFFVSVKFISAMCFLFVLVKLSHFVQMKYKGSNSLTLFKWKWNCSSLPILFKWNELFELSYLVQIYASVTHYVFISVELSYLFKWQRNYLKFLIYSNENEIVRKIYASVTCYFVQIYASATRYLFYFCSTFLFVQMKMKIVWTFSSCSNENEVVRKIYASVTYYSVQIYASVTRYILFMHSLRIAS